MNEADRLPWNSGARVEGTTLTLMVDTAPLREHVSQYGVRLGDAPGAPRGKSPLIVDLWRVVSGRIETFGIDQHTWSTTTGAAALAAFGGVAGASAGSSFGALDGASAGAAAGSALGPLGSMWGAFAGFFVGGATGAWAGLASGAARGAKAGAGLGESVSSRMSRSFGTYEEVLVAAPFAHVDDASRGPYMFVLGMRSNGPVSIWGDRTLGFGYRKLPSAITRVGFERYDVEGDSAPVASFAGRGVAAWASVGASLDPFRAIVSAQPLLGFVEESGFVVTYLDRFFDAAEFRWSPASGRLAVGPGFISGVPEGDHALRPLGPKAPWGAFHAESLPVKVTYPRPIGGLTGS